MEIRYPFDIDALVNVSRVIHNQMTADGGRLTQTDILHVLQELEMRVGVVGSADSTSISARLARIEQVLGLESPEIEEEVLVAPAGLVLSAYARDYTRAAEVVTERLTRLMPRVVDTTTAVEYKQIGPGKRFVFVVDSTTPSDATYVLQRTPIPKVVDTQSVVGYVTVSVRPPA